MSAPKVIPIRSVGSTATPRQDTAEEQERQRIASEVAAFAGFIACARALWRQYPELVEAPEFPADLRAAYREEVAGTEDPIEDHRSYGGDGAALRGLYRAGIARTRRGLRGRSTRGPKS